MPTPIVVASLPREDQVVPVTSPTWSWKLGNLFGIGVYVHASFLLLLVWIVMTHVSAGQGTREILRGIALVVAVFAIIVMHELGHALTARRFGIATRNIVLLPIGGVASLERMPEKPSQELLVALAGPAVNLVLAAVLAGVAFAMGVGLAPSQLTLTGGSTLQKLVFINLTLAVFNLIPAFPMDGGRVLRAALSFRMTRERATDLAARLGQGIAILFGILGIMANPMLVLIAVFVWIGAAQEAASVKMRSVLSGMSVRYATITDFLTLEPQDQLAVAVEHVLARSQHEFPVVDGARLVGVLTRSDVLRGLTEHGPTVRVADAMHRTFRTATPDEPLETVMPRLVGDTATPVMVVEEGHLIGMLTAENLAELVMLKSAVHVA